MLSRSRASRIRPPIFARLPPSIPMSPNSSSMIDPGQPPHGSYRNIQLSHFELRTLPYQLIDYAKIFLYGAPDIFQRFRFAGTLRPAARQTWTGNAVPFFRFPQNHFVSHDSSSSVAASAQPSTEPGHTTAIA